MQTRTAQPEFGPRRVGVLCRLPASCMAQLREHEVLLKLTWPARLERERSCQMGRRKRRKHVEASEAAAAVAGSRCSFNLRPGLRRTVPPLLSCAAMQKAHAERLGRQRVSAQGETSVIAQRIQVEAWLLALLPAVSL